MTTIHIAGWNHRRAPVELRERLAFRAEELPEALETLGRDLGARELAVISTCNRVEVTVVPGERPFATEDLLRALARLRSVEVDALAPRLYHHAGEDAVRHIFRVAAGLDSMVVGETQVLGQVKDAYAVAQREGRTGKVLNRVFQRAFHVAKRVHASTRLGAGGDSVPTVAARLAERVFEDLHRRRVLVLGAGETAELAAIAFRHRGVRQFTVANRTRERAEELARQIGGAAAGLEEFPSLLSRADIVVACVETQRPLVDEAAARAALRERRGDPMLILDLGVPRNVDPTLSRLESLYLFDVDDLEGIVGRNASERRTEIQRSEQIVDEETKQAMDQLALDSQAALIGELQMLATEVVSSQPLETQSVVRKAIGQYLHEATIRLRNGSLDLDAAKQMIRKVSGRER